LKLSGSNKIELALQILEVKGDALDRRRDVLDRRSGRIGPSDARIPDALWFKRRLVKRE
jgi:hypothetical protein